VQSEAGREGQARAEFIYLLKQAASGGVSGV
jgi:hypothetical protein